MRFLRFSLSGVVCCLLLWGAPIFSQETYDQYNEALLETYLSQADEEQSREDWQLMAQFGLDAVTADWESALSGLITDPQELAALKAAVQADIQAEVDQRYLDWIVQGYQESLSGEEIALLWTEMGRISEDFIYQKDSEGNRVLDELGNPVVLDYQEFFDVYQDNPDGSQTLLEEGDGTLWRQAAQEAIEGILDGWRTAFWAGVDTLSQGLEAAQQEELQNKLAEEESLFVSATQQEMNKVFQIEQQSFRNARLGDIDSLRNKYDQLTAEAMTQQMIDDIKVQTAIDIQNLQDSLATAIENPDAGTELSVTQWQISFQNELDKGLALWDEAEEGFFAQRLAWEQNASQTFAETDQKWADAFQGLKEARRDWTLEFQKTIEKGVELWETRLGEMNGSIQNAKTEIMENIAQEQGSLEGRIQTLIDMMAQSVDMMRSARDNFMYWQEHLHPEDFPGDSMGWDPAVMRRELLNSVLRETRGPSYEAEWERQRELEADLLREYESDGLAQKARHQDNMDEWDDASLQETKDYLSAFISYLSISNYHHRDYTFHNHTRYLVANDYGGNPDDKEEFVQHLQGLVYGGGLATIFEENRSAEERRYSRAISNLEERYYGDRGEFDQFNRRREEALFDAQPFHASELSVLWTGALRQYWASLSDDDFAAPDFWTKTREHFEGAANPFIGQMTAEQAQERQTLLITALRAIEEEDYSGLAPLMDQATEQEKIRQTKKKGYLAQSRYWLEEVFMVYRDYADQGADDMARLYGVVVFDDETVATVAGSDTAGILQGSWDNLLMDNYQKEVLKAKALEGFWARELAIAQEVTRYALDNTGERESESETEENLTRAEEDYNEAFDAYNTAVEALEGYQEQLGDSQEVMALIRQRLEEKAAELDEAKRGYHQLLAIYRLDEGTIIEGNYHQKYDQLLRLLGVIEDEKTTTRAQAMAEYMAAQARHEGESSLVRQAQQMSFLIQGATVSEDPGAPVILSMAVLQEQIQNIQDFTLPLDAQGELDPMNMEDFRSYLRESLYLEESSSAFKALSTAYQFSILTDFETGEGGNWEDFMAQAMPTLLQIQLGAQAELAAREAELGLYSAPSLSAWAQRYLEAASYTGTESSETLLENAAGYRQGLLEAQVRSLVDQDIRWMDSLVTILESGSAPSLPLSLTASSGYSDWAQNPINWMAWSYYQKQAALQGDDLNSAALTKELKDHLAGLESLKAILDLGGRFEANAGALRDWKAENQALEIYLQGQGIYAGDTGSYGSLITPAASQAYREALAVERVLRSADGTQGSVQNLVGDLIRKERSEKYLTGLQSMGILQGTSALQDPRGLWSARNFTQISQVQTYLRDLQAHMNEYDGSLPGYMEEALGAHAQAVATFFAAQSLTLNDTLSRSSDDIQGSIQAQEDQLQVLGELYSELTMPGADQLNSVSALLAAQEDMAEEPGSPILSAQDIALAQEAWTEALSWKAVEASYSLDALDLGDSAAVQTLLADYGAEEWNDADELAALVSSIQSLAQQYRRVTDLMLDEELSPAELAALSDNELRLIKWAQWQNLSPLALWEGLGSSAQAETGEYALALYSVHQYLEDNSFAEDRDLQEALGDLFLQELYGGSSLALTVAQGYGFMDEQALWLTGESSWSLMMDDLTSGPWIFVQEDASLPSSAQWQDYLDQKVTLGDDYGAIRSLLGLDPMADVLEDPADWLGNAEYISRLLDSYQSSIGGSLADRETLAIELLSILDVSLTGEERNDLIGLADAAARETFFMQYLESWQGEDWRSLREGAGELYLRADLERTIAAQTSVLQDLDPPTVLSEDALQSLIVDWKSRTLYSAGYDKQRAYQRMSWGLQDDAFVDSHSSLEYQEKVLGLLAQEQAVWGLDPDADHPGSDEVQRSFALGLYAAAHSAASTAGGYEAAASSALGRWLLEGLGQAAEDGTLLVIQSGDEDLIYRALFSGDDDLRDYVIKEAVVHQGWDRDEVISRLGIVPDAELEEFIRLAGISGRYLPGIDEDLADYWDREYQVTMGRESELKALQAAGYTRSWADEYFFAGALGTQVSAQEALFGYEITGSRLAQNMGGLYAGIHGQGGYLDVWVQENTLALQERMEDEQEGLMGQYSDLAYTTQLETLLERINPADLDPSWRYYLTVVNMIADGESWERPSDEWVYEYQEPRVTDLIVQDGENKMVTSTSVRTTLIQEAYNEALGTAGMAAEALAQQTLMESGGGSTVLMDEWKAEQADIWGNLVSGSSLSLGNWSLSQGVLEEMDRAHGQYLGISGSIDNLKGELAVMGSNLEIYYAEKENDVDVVVADIKRDIEEIQWQMAALDDLWDQLILGDPNAWKVEAAAGTDGNPGRAAFVLELIDDLDQLGTDLRSYASIEEEYQRTYQGLTASYTALEDAKQEYKVRKGIYEYASSGYLTDGSDLELTDLEEADLKMYQMLIASTPLDRLRRAQSQYRMARASLDALEGLGQDHQDHLVDLYSTDAKYKDLVDSYTEHFKSKIALAEMERILQESIAEKDRQTEEAYAAWSLELQKLFGSESEAIGGLLGTKDQYSLDVSPYLPEDTDYEDLESFEKMAILLRAQDGIFEGLSLDQQSGDLSSIGWSEAESQLTADDLEDYFMSTSRESGYLHDLHMYSQYLLAYKNDPDNTGYLGLIEKFSLALAWEQAPRDDRRWNEEDGEWIYGQEFKDFIGGAESNGSDAVRKQTDTEQKVYDEMEKAHSGMSAEERRYYEFFKLQVLMDSGFELGDFKYGEIQTLKLAQISFQEAQGQSKDQAQRHWRNAGNQAAVAGGFLALAAVFSFFPPAAAAYVAMALPHTILAIIEGDKAHKWDIVSDEAKSQKNAINKQRSDARSASVSNLNNLAALRTDYENKKADLDLMSGASDEDPNDLDDLTDAILKAYEVSDKDLGIIGEIGGFTANRASLRIFLDSYYDETNYSMEDMEDNRRLLNAVQGTADLKVQEASDLREAYLWDNSPDQKGLAVRHQEASAELEALEEDFQRRGVVDALPNADQVKADLEAWEQAMSEGTDASALRVSIVEHARIFLEAYDDPNMASLGIDGTSAFRYGSRLAGGQEYEYYAPNQALWTIKQAYEDFLTLPTDAGADQIASLLLDYQERYQLYLDYQEQLAEVHGAGQTYNQRHTQTQLYKTFEQLYEDLTATDSETSNVLNSSSSIILDEMNRILAGNTNSGSDHAGLLEYSRNQYTEVKFYELDLLYKETELEAQEWQGKMDAIFYRGMIEWNKSEREFRSKWNTWRKRYTEEFNSKSQEWNEEYLEFVSDKADWVQTMTVKSTQIGSSLNTLSDETSTAIATAMETAVTNMLIENEEDPNSIANRLMSNSLFTQLSSAGAALLDTVGENRFAFNTALRRTGFDTAGTMKDFKDFQQIQNEEMKNRLAAIQLEKMIDSFQARIDNIALRVDETNDYWDNYTEDSLTASGFRRDGNYFVKDIVTGSTITTPVVRELRKIQEYQDMLYETPDLETASGIRNYGLVYDFDAVQAIIAEATQVVEAEEDRVFGTGERLWRAGGGAWKELEEAPDFSQESVREKGWQNKGDGLFGEYVGYAPIYKSGYDLDMSKSRSKNIEHAGSGELGRIMGLLNWYNMEEGAGYSKVNMPAWDKPMWDTFEILPGWEMEAPSFAGAVDLVVQAVATIATAPVGGFGGAVLGAAIGSVDDLMFTALEVGTGYIIPEQALLQVGQTLLKAGVQTVMSGVMNGFETWDAVADPKHIGGGLMSWAGDNGVLKGILSAGNQGVTNVLNGLIQGTEITLDDDGNFEGFRFNGRTFEKMTVGEGALGGYLSSFVGTASTQMFQDLLPKVDLGDFGIDLKMDTSKINALGSTLGGLMGELASVAADGEFTMNLLNLSDLMIWFGGMGTKEAQNYSMGLFEFGIGLNDEGKMVSRSRFGTGGAKLNLASNWGVWDQIGKVLNVNKDIKKAQNVRKSIRDGGENTFNGDSEVSADLIEILFYEEEAAKPTPSARPRISNIPSLGDPTLPTFPVETPEQKAQREEQERKQQEFKEDVAKIEALSEEEQLAAIKELIEKGIKGIDTSYSLENAEGFMKKYVTEEDLVAFDLDALIADRISSFESFEEAIAQLILETADVNNLSSSFEKAYHHFMINALDSDENSYQLSKSEMLQALLLQSNDYANEYTRKFNNLARSEVINDHFIFNPFDQDFEANMQALAEADTKVLQEQNLLHSRTMRAEIDGNHFVYLMDSQQTEDLLRSAGVMDERGQIREPAGFDELTLMRNNSRIYRFDAQGISSPDHTGPKGAYWEDNYYKLPSGLEDVLATAQYGSTVKYSYHEGNLVIHELNGESLNNQLPGVEVLDVQIMRGNDVLLPHSRTWYRQNDKPRDLTLVDLYHAGFARRKIRHFEGNLYNIKFGHNNYSEYDDLYNSSENMNVALKGTYDIGAGVDHLLRVAGWMPGFDNTQYNLVNQKYDDFRNDPSDRYNQYQLFQNNGINVYRSNTWCDLVLAQRGMSYVPDDLKSEIYSTISGSSFSDKFANDPNYASISLDYAALLSRTSALVIGQMSSVDGASGHVNQMVDAEYRNGEFHYYFSQGGEWNSRRLNTISAWGVETNKKLRDKVGFYLYIGLR